MILIEYLKRNIYWVLGFFAVVCIFSFLQFKFNLIHAPNVIKIGIIGTYQQHDLPQELTRLISEGLTTASEEGKIMPVLVSGWEVNNDATQYKFKLKDNLKWSDNTQISSSDLDFAIPNTVVSFPEKGIIQFNLKESLRIKEMPNRPRR